LLESVLQPQPRGWFSRLLGQGRRLQFAFLARQLVGNAYQRTPDGGWEGKRLQLRPKLSRIFRQRA
jgi:hypothetical protein